ncbi:PEP-CTERM sorting domain-containing protein [Mariniblastus sp.]|nr:PEP-CTERM sorting domain-containing protein [Mariniblastus sp.]
MTLTTKNLTLLFLLGTFLLLGSQANADLIVNGSFEDDAPGTGDPDITGWSVLEIADVVKSDVNGSTFTTLDMVGSQDGDNAFQLQDNAGAPRLSGLTSDAFSVATAGDFSLSAFFANRGNFAAADAFTLDLLDSNGAIVAPTAFVDPALQGGVYVEFTRAYTGLAAGNYSVQLAATKPNSQLLQGTVDNISFVSTAVPEPTSVALLGLGGALMMIRRRR